MSEIGVNQTWLKFIGIFLLLFIISAFGHSIVSPMNLGINTTDPLKLAVAFLISYGGTFVIFFFVLGLPIAYLANRKSKPALNKLSYLYKALYPAIIVQVLFLYVGWSQNTEQTEEGSVVQSTDVSSEIRASISIQKSEGFDSSSLNQESLDNFEMWAKEMWVKKTNNYFIENNIKSRIHTSDINSSAVYLDTNGKRLAVIKMKMSSVRNTLIIGFDNDELKRVSCIRKANKDIPLSYGICADKINKAFGITLV